MESREESEDSQDSVAASEFLPSKGDIDGCRRCPLWQRATQGVPGEGSPDARIIIVGEQPGDEEDRQGKPFVGPAGRLLDRALRDAKIPRSDIYVTNAVKHFGWVLRGKRRLHKKPLQRQVEACQGWLEAEIAALRPAVIVTLGATAIFAVAGRRIGVAEARAAALVGANGARIIATYHPSAMLRAVDDSRRDTLYRLLVADLRRARDLAETTAETI